MVGRIVSRSTLGTPFFVITGRSITVVHHLRLTSADGKADTWN